MSSLISLGGKLGLWVSTGMASSIAQYVSSFPSEEPLPQMYRDEVQDQGWSGWCMSVEPFDSFEEEKLCTEHFYRAIKSFYQENIRCCRDEIKDETYCFSLAGVAHLGMLLWLFERRLSEMPREKARNAWMSRPAQIYARPCHISLRIHRQIGYTNEATYALLQKEVFEKCKAIFRRRPRLYIPFERETFNPPRALARKDELQLKMQRKLLRRCINTAINDWDVDPDVFEPDGIDIAGMKRLESEFDHFLFVVKKWKDEESPTNRCYWYDAYYDPRYQNFWLDTAGIQYDLTRPDDDRFVFVEK